MKSALAVIAGLIATFSTVPYLIDIIRRKTKPNIVSWFTWTLLLAIATAAAFAAHEPRTALLTFGDTVCTLAVVILGLRYGIAKLSRFDFLCQAGAILGLVLWLIFNSPQIAIIFSLAIDFIVMMPTVRHSWLMPKEETWQTFAIGVFASALTLISLVHYSFSSLAFPVYLGITNALIALTIIYSRKRKGLSLAR